MPDESTMMGPGGEFDLIRRMATRWGDTASGIGDDAALLDVPPGHRLVASTDTSVDGVHFRREWLTLAEAGYRAAVAALSDLAAMAAEPLGMLVAATLPSEDVTSMDALADGIGDAARRAGCRIVGGDLSRGYRLSLTITVLGHAAAPLTRRGAVPGQAVYVTGRLGGPAAALQAFLGSLEPAPALRERFVRPVPRLDEARWLLSAGATAMIDISDGLAPEARHLAAASGVALEVVLDDVPAMDGVDHRQAALGGEEYELLLAGPPDLDVGAFARRFGIPLTRIGRVVNGHATATFLQEGRRVDLSGGYDHFSR